MFAFSFPRFGIQVNRALDLNFLLLSSQNIEVLFSRCV